MKLLNIEVESFLITRSLFLYFIIWACFLILILLPFILEEAAIWNYQAVFRNVKLVTYMQSEEFWLFKSWLLQVIEQLINFSVFSISILQVEVFPCLKYSARLNNYVVEFTHNDCCREINDQTDATLLTKIRRSNEPINDEFVQADRNEAQ